MSTVPWAWHLYWQAALGRDFLAHPSLPSALVASLVEAHRGHHRGLLDFLVLRGEVHLLSRLPDEEDASTLARVVGGALSRHVRGVQPVRSPVLACQCRATLIEGMTELRQELRMLHWRALSSDRREVEGRQGYSGSRELLRGAPPTGWDTAPLLLLFGDDSESAVGALHAFLGDPPVEQHLHSWALMRGLQRARGHLGPRERRGTPISLPGAAQLLAAAGEAGIDGALRLIERWVRERLALPSEAGLRDLSGPEGTRARALVAAIAVHHGLCGITYVARHYGRAKGTMSPQLAALQRRPADAWLSRTPAVTILHAKPDCRDLKHGARPSPGAARGLKADALTRGH